MGQKLEPGDRAPNFDLPGVYGYKSGATSPSHEDGVRFKLKDYEGKKWVVLVFYHQDSSPEDTRLLVSFNGYNRKFTTKEIELLCISQNGVNSHRQFIEVYQLGFSLVADEKKEVTELYGVIREEKNQFDELEKKVHRTTMVIDKTGMIRNIWQDIEDLREHPREVWEYIAKEKGV